MKRESLLSFRTIFIENQCRCSFKCGYLVVRKADESRKIHLAEISSILLESQQVYISAYLLSELAKRKIPLVVSDELHNPVGEYLPLYGAHNCSKKVLEQLSWTLPRKKRVWQHIVQHKISQQAYLIKRFRPEHFSTLCPLVNEVKSGDVGNCEAIAARLYFMYLFGSDYNRDLDIPINRALNYGYAILLSYINRLVVSHGFLTQLGIHHKSEYNHFNFSCDLMEPFRPVVDNIVLQNYQEVEFKDMKKKLANFINEEAVYKEGRYRISSIMSHYVDEIIAALNGDISSRDVSFFEYAYGTFED